jgi:hypothetical protein
MKVLALVLAITALGAVSAASGGTRASTAGNPSTFPDSAGDSGAGPDITNVVVGNTVAGLVRFEISLANAGVLLPDDHFVGVFIDADRNPSTGYQEGFEYTVQTAGSFGELLLGRWNGSDFEEVSAPSLLKVWEGGGKMTFRVSKADLGNTTGFSFFAATELMSVADDEFADTAPDGIAAFSYTLTTPRIASVRPRYLPATPRAGRPFRVTGVTMKLESDEVLPAASFRCRATLGGKALRGGGSGGCTYSLPRKAKGKRLVLVVTATRGEQSRALRAVLRVR